MTINILFVDQVSENIMRKMEDGLKEYELSHGVHVDYTPFAFELYNGKNDVIGVLDAFSSYSSIHIRDLWVDKAYRGKGYGRRLIDELENHFQGKGFNNINTVSCAFQAPDFYKKCGFQVEFIRENLDNPKLSTTFLVKFFD
jgi:ribosomal protein S18 acetylase RimI-like enzyme